MTNSFALCLSSSSVSEVVEITGLFSSASLLRFSKCWTKFYSCMNQYVVRFTEFAVLMHQPPKIMQTFCTVNTSHHISTIYVLSNGSLRLGTWLFGNDRTVTLLREYRVSDIYLLPHSCWLVISLLLLFIISITCPR